MGVNRKKSTQLLWETWPEEKLKWFKKLYPITVNKELGFIFEISKSTIIKAGKALGLKKSEQTKNLGQFKKGHIPSNKGKKVSAELKEKYKHTWFKKGHLPKNTKYDGAISVRKDKRTGINYKYIRLEKGKWELLHRVVYQKHFPEDSLKTSDYIRFKDGNQLNCKIENLEKISREQNMALNTIHRYPEELKTAIRTQAKLENKILKYGT